MELERVRLGVGGYGGQKGSVSVERCVEIAGLEKEEGWTK